MLPNKTIHLKISHSEGIPQDYSTELKSNLKQRKFPAVTKKGKEAKSTIQNMETRKIEPNSISGIPTTVNKLSLPMLYNLPSTPLYSKTGGWFERNKMFYTRINKTYQNTD